MNRTKFIAYTAVFTALVAVATIVFVFPLPAGRGFINFGDAIIFVTGILFGPFAGMIAGGIGSASADLILGYAIWAPFTLIIKGLEGVVVGFVSMAVCKMLKPKLHFLAYIIAMVVAGIVMITGYFFATAIIVKSFEVAAIGIIDSLIQIGVSIGIASLLLAATKSIIFAIKKRNV
ncbi:MAG: ECF transporter S component [Bacillota bacterium]